MRKSDAMHGNEQFVFLFIPVQENGPSTMASRLDDIETKIFPCLVLTAPARIPVVKSRVSKSSMPPLATETRVVEGGDRKTLLPLSCKVGYPRLLRPTLHRCRTSRTEGRLSSDSNRVAGSSRPCSEKAGRRLRTRFGRSSRGTMEVVRVYIFG